MPTAYLQIVSGTRQGTTVPVVPGGVLTIGRKRGELVLDDPLVSSVHCRLLWRDDGLVLQDLGSTNGTLVGGRAVKEARLEPGSEISVGGSRMILFLAEEPEPKPAASEEPVIERPGAEIAWLLDEELVELRGASERTRTAADVIGQDLRLPPGLNAMVEVIAGQDAGKIFRFTRGNVTIGRRQGEVPINDVEVSRHHAVIEVFGRSMVFLRDLRSTNGTYHNGRRVSVSQLQPGDTIGCGKTVMKLQVTW